MMLEISWYGCVSIDMYTDVYAEVHGCVCAVFIVYIKKSVEKCARSILIGQTSHVWCTYLIVTDVLSAVLG